MANYKIEIDNLRPMDDNGSVMSQKLLGNADVSAHSWNDEGDF